MYTCMPKGDTALEYSPDVMINLGTARRGAWPVITCGIKGVVLCLLAYIRYSTLYHSHYCHYWTSSVCWNGMQAISDDRRPKPVQLRGSPL